MISKEILKEIIVSNEAYIERLGKIIHRESFVLPEKIEKVVDIYGVRRSGKTYCLFDIFKQSNRNALYIDFEDDRLAGFELDDFPKLKDAFLELKPQMIGKKLVFLLDEVQNVEGWERFARRAVERENINVFVTGSSSKMTSRQLHTILRGRSWGIEIFPFSFREYLGLKNINIESAEISYGESRDTIKKYFFEYLKWGGFPEVCILDSEIERTKVINEYLEAIFFKDLVERFKISNIPLLDALREKLFSSFSQKLSLSAFYKQAKDNFSFSKDSLFAYYKYFLESMIIFEIRKFSPSSYKRLRNPAKIYLVDSSLSRKVTSEDKGRQLENLIFLELKRIGFDFFYFEEKNECDFIAKDARGNLFPFQVTWEINEKNQEREFGGLIEACKFLELKKGRLLTYDEENTRTMEGIEIEIVPAWKWLIKR